MPPHRQAVAVGCHFKFLSSNIMSFKTFLILIFCFLSPVVYGQVSENVRQAVKLGDSLKFKEAIILLKNEIKNHPNDADAYYWLGRYSHFLVYDSRPFTQKSNKWSKQEVIANLKKAIQLNPKFGDAYYFLGVEYSARAREAIEKNNIKQAKAELRAAKEAGAFPDYMLEYARNILQYCEPNAILFSNQDAAVNALMYVQLVEDFRKDISVIAVNLLERPFYVKYMRDGIPNEITKIPISWNDNLIMNMYSYFPWKEQDIKIKISQGKKKEYHLPDSVNEMVLDVKDKYGSGSMWIGTAAILNILENNKFERPIYCALPDGDDMFEFTDYLQNQGFVSKFMPYKEKGTANEYNKTKIEASILNPENYRKFDDIKLHNEPRADYFFCDNERNIIIGYVEFLIESNNRDEAKIVYLKMNSLMPVSVYPLSKELEKKCTGLEKQLSLSRTNERPTRGSYVYRP
jgi:hypothetical protein